MKNRIFTFLLMFVLAYTCFAQLQWQTQCTRRPLTSIKFVSSTKAWIFGGNGYSGGNILYKSTNRGDNWSLPFTQNVLTDGASYKTLCFVDSSYGWAGRDNTSIFKTTNGGDNWFSLSVGISYGQINSIYFMNRNIGWLAGRDTYYHSLICKTTNGGLNWSLISSNLNFEPSQIFMLNEYRGYATPNSTGSLDSVASTSDGGFSWNYFRAGGLGGWFVRRILFLDSLNGWILGENSYVSRTTNGGINWVLYNNNILNTWNMFFLNNMTGWIAGSYNEVWKTTNSGTNWVKEIGTVYYNGSYKDIYFKDQNTGWAIGDDGTVIKSTNGGNNWLSLIEPPNSSVNRIYFINSYTGWLVTYEGYISKTINGGNNWFTLTTSNSILNSIQFTNNSTGFIAGTSGKIFKSIDGGQSWDSLSIGNYSYNSVDFDNPNTGWICGSTGQILKTTNSGLSWLNQTSGTSNNLNSIQFLNLSTGYIVGDSGKILKTMNGGTNWTINQPLGDHSYTSIFFINSSTGWVIGNKTSSGQFWGTEKVIIKTSNGGNNWTTYYSSFSLYQGLAFRSIYFINSETGWIATNYDGILKTTNGGLNWYADLSPIGEAFHTIYFVDNETGWIAGDNGTVLTTGNFPIGIKKSITSSPKIFSLSQNYPNPFNPVTRIKFDLPKSSNVKLVIYDVLGRDIETLVNENKRPGTYEVDWPATGGGSRYASGVYFYKLITDDYVQTKKMVLIK